MKILVAVDGGPAQADALTFGADLARARGEELVVVHVHRPGSRRARDVVAAADTLLGAAAHRTLLVEADDVVATLHDAAALEDADVLVVGASRRGAVRRAWAGALGDRLLRGAPCAIAVAPAGHALRPGAPHRIGVAFDGSAESRAALRWARMLAAAGGELVVLSVVEPVAADRLRATLRRERRAELDGVLSRRPHAVAAEARLLEGDPVPRLREAAAGLDLLVCGTRALGTFGAALRGSVARTLFHTAPCPVVALPGSAVREPSRAPVAT